MSHPAPAGYTDDHLLKGRVKLRQLAAGYRAAIDPVLLAAALPPARTALELGCGTGAASLCALARLPDMHITGLECDAATADLARHNAETNGMTARFRVLTADIGDPRAFPEGSVELAFANPPYLPPTRANPSPNAHKRQSDVETPDTPLGAWVQAALRALKPGGTLLFIQRADRLDGLLHALRDKAGEIVIFPLWPKAGQPAKRLLLRARKGINSPLRLAPGLVLHEPDGRYSTAAEAILRDGAPLALDAPARV